MPQKPTPEVLKDRERIIKLLESHSAHISEQVFGRLCNLIRIGLDLDEEMKLPPHERAIGFHWPDCDDDDLLGIGEVE